MQPVGDGITQRATHLNRRAFAAQRRLAFGGEASVADLRNRLRPVGDKAVVADLTGLVEQLDAETFAIRRQAFDALAKEGKRAEQHLRKLLAGKPSAEARRRANELLARLARRSLSGEPLREVRALEVLEWISTASARRLVEELSRGRADAPLTGESRATRKRMGK